MLQTRVIPPAEGAYQYPLLIKRLLMSGTRYEKTREIIYRDKLRYTYPTLIERVARLANVLTEAGVKAGDGGGDGLGQPPLPGVHVCHPDDWRGDSHH